MVDVSMASGGIGCGSKTAKSYPSSSHNSDKASDSEDYVVDGSAASNSVNSVDFAEIEGMDSMDSASSVIAGVVDSSDSDGASYVQPLPLMNTLEIARLW